MTKINIDATQDELAALSKIHLETCLALAGGSYLKAAEQLGIPVGTVKSRVNRARAAIAKMRSKPDEKEKAGAAAQGMEVGGEETSGGEVLR